MAGRRMWNKFLIENIDLFETELPEFPKYIFAYIEPLDLTEESFSGYLRLMGKSILSACREHTNSQKIDGSSLNVSIFDDETASYTKLLDTLKAYLKKIVDSGFELVLFLGEFDELNFATAIFYNNLRSLWGSFSSSLHYIFLMREEVTKKEKITLWGDFSEVLLQNIVYIPLLDSPDFNYSFDRITMEFGITAEPEYKKVIEELCGGHPYMLKVCLKVITKLDGQKLSPSELEKLLSDHYELQSVSQGIFEVHSDETKAVIRKVARGKPLTESDKWSIDFLSKLRLIIPTDNGQYKLFGKLFGQTIAGFSEGHEHARQDHQGLKIEDETGAVLMNGQTVEEKFTHQEYAILTMFLQKANHLCTRDDIGEALWGKESYEKYSEWAIDQLMSKLRRKLAALGVRDNLTTVRGKGYKFITASS